MDLVIIDIIWATLKMMIIMITMTMTMTMTMMMKQVTNLELQLVSFY